MPDLKTLQTKTPSITKEEIQALPLAEYKGPIHVINPEQSCVEACEAISQEEIIGFDTETRPAFRKGESYLPSLVQLATRHAVYLFQINKDYFPPELFRIFENTNLKKSGIAIKQDITKLKEIKPFNEQGMVDLAASAAQQGIKTTGLRSLAAIFLGVRVSKGAQVTNWAKPTLTPAQIQYAAVDAWISRELYFKLH